MQALPIPALLAASLVLAACSTTGQKPVDKLNKTWVENRVGYYDALAKGDEIKTENQDHLTSALDTPELRNGMIEDVLRLIDLDYEQFTTTIRRSKSYTDLGLDILSIGLGTYGTLTGSSETKTVLSALNTALAGGRASFDKNVLLEQTIPVLIAKMGAQRAKQKLYIRSRMYRDATPASIASYSVTEALTDLTEYYYAGTLTHALAAVGEDAAAEKKAADDELKDRGTYGPNKDTTSLQTYLKPNGKLDQARLKIVRQWILDHVGDITITSFLYQDQYASDRAILLATLQR